MMDRGVDMTGAHTVHPNSLGGHLSGKSTGENLKRAFRGRIVDVFVGSAGNDGS